MFLSRVRILAAIIAAASVESTALAQTPPPAFNAEDETVAAAVDFTKTLTARATAALTDPGADDAQRLENFRGVLVDGLALETIGRFMLGETRKSMSDEQMTRYQAIFPVYITKLYAEQFEEIVGKPLNVIDARAFGSRDVLVRTQFDRKDDAPVNVDWRVRKLSSGDHKAIDIIVGGVSIMLVKREEFSAFITANGVDALIDRLEQDTFA